MHRWGGTIAAVGLLVVLGVTLLIRETGFDIDVPFVSRGGDPDPTSEALRRDEVPPYSAPQFTDVRGSLSLVGEGPVEDLVLTVTVEPPEGAEMMQLADTPGFDGIDWQPLSDTVDVPVSSAGYQTVFARFRLADGSISRTSVAGGEIDQTWSAATSSADGPHRASWVRPLSPTEVVVRIEAGRIVEGGLEPYDLDDPADGDDITEVNGITAVRRDGETYGLQVSQRRDVIRRPDVLVGRALDGAAVAGGSWSIASADDPAYGEGAAAVEVDHLARPTDGGLDGDGQGLMAAVHDFVVTLPGPLQQGSTYRFELPGDVEPVELAYDPATNPSPSVRVNQVGYAPGDTGKVAFVAGRHDGIGLSAVADTTPAFRVVDADSGAEVFSGTGRAKGTVDELGQGDLTGSPVVELDFSALTTPGRYRVCVDAIGCSHDFEIDDGVWTGLATTVARALFHQRSGITLGPPYTPIQRPRPYHPDDGMVVEATTYTLIEAQTETANTDFDLLSELRTGDVVPEAWGGHMDAGDWDRRINHLWFARNIALLITELPELAELDLNIPESGDRVPDLLDEALWTVDLYHRMQLDDGSIRGGIEASAHPPLNAASWVDDLAVLAYGPDVWSSYVYAGVAADMAVALEPYDSARADDLLDSALRAMDWAEGREVGPTLAERVDEQRAVAAASLLAATGDAAWHAVFLESAAFLDDADPYLSCHSHSRCDAAWAYLHADETLTDPTIRNDLRARFVASATAAVEGARSTGYGWTVDNPFVPLIWGLGAGGAPHVSGLLRAHLLTGDEVYREAAVRSASFTLGANPLNRAMLTGVGDEPVRNPQINDVKSGGIPAWAGTPVYGYHRFGVLDNDTWAVEDILTPAGATPDPLTLPYLWQWYDVDSIAMFNEFTVHQSHGEALLAFAVLAATGSS